MHLNVCKYCHKIFHNYYKLSTCETCKQRDDDLFEKIEVYLCKYPNSNALQIAEGLMIPASAVLSFIDEGRLMISKGYFEKN